eukprot:CAMPEP_0206240526 /NCGR_PEP_ID=MMETSP0047_2-20121206/15987_1 /ASSEMBLY_ACC=CAM_ASM_000192 /TAXON_ID=195065 /ORGANISM="Chroomonas mesostigmatica_cf, Strain CCMP1168" /LENGTH=374 /DNA_ID=CAMNT_0053665317 /DNA_START=157 /DNA_END=1281 /DNA_ORIENTATION=-
MSSSALRTAVRRGVGGPLKSLLAGSGSQRPIASVAMASQAPWKLQGSRASGPSAWAPRSSHLAGPVASRRFQSTGPAQAEPANPPAPMIFEVLQENFVEAVVNSEEPVIVNCFAEWCKEQIGPMANAVSGTPGVKLAVMDVDKCPQFAAQLQITNLPTIFLFHKGKALDKQVGSLAPEGVASLVKKAQALSGAVGPTANELMVEAGKLLSQSKVQEALQMYMHVSQISREAHGASALSGMALCALAVKDNEAAKDLIETIKAEFPKNLEDPIVKQACNAVELTGDTVAPEAVMELQAKVEKDADDHASRHELALALFGMQQYGDAMKQCLEIIKRDKAWEEGKARTLLFKFFETLGNDHKEVIAARKRLASLLF